MDKLVIAVTVDSTGSHPANPYCPPGSDIDAVAAEYIRAVNAGASITHIHGVIRREVLPDGRRIPRLDLEGWKAYQEKIEAGCQPILQFGIAGAPLEERLPLMDLRPDMMSVIFTAHDIYYHNDRSRAPTEVYALHTREELEAYCRATNERRIKIEVESFHPGAFFNIELMASKGLLPEPVWTSVFFWPGGNSTPPTFKALLYVVDHLPRGLRMNWCCCGMEPWSYQRPEQLATYWQMLTMAIMMGGHVRVGWEDCPYLDDRGTLARTNALLVEKVVRIARELGREIATCEEAREIIGLPSRKASGEVAPMA